MDTAHDEYPPKADLRKDLSRPLPFIPPGTVDSAAVTEDVARSVALTILDTISESLLTRDDKKLASCFFHGQAFWRDMVALTSHIRTFTTPHVIAAALLQTTLLRKFGGEFQLRVAKFIPATPVLQFIECKFIFRTNQPGATCNGRLIILPIKGKGRDDVDVAEWKIWILSTWIENLDIQAEDETLLLAPPTSSNNTEVIETDVLIIGAGNSGITLAARLKALNVGSIMIEENAEVGENWTSRYDCLHFHLPTASCEMPYKRYDKELQTPHLLTKDEVAKHLKDYVAAFNLNFLGSIKILSTLYSKVAKQWTLRLQTPHGIKTVSVVIIGSANTAFDIIEDCYAVGLRTSINARSPTYIFPIAYCHDVHGLGAYDVMPIEEADKMLMTLPLSVDGQLIHGLFSHLASQEPDRYKALAATGFPVIDSRHPDANLHHNLVERSGGHYVDLGSGVDLIAEGKVAVKGGTEPVAYTETGLRFSDGSTLDTDAVVWCTGFADKNAKATVSTILGGGCVGDGADTGDQHILGPSDIAAHLDATWGVDFEGEVRGMWKRHRYMDNFWVMGGNIQHQRWWSRILAQQIKLALADILPPAYRDTPKVAAGK